MRGSRLEEELCQSDRLGKVSRERLAKFEAEIKEAIEEREVKVADAQAALDKVTEESKL